MATGLQAMLLRTTEIRAASPTLRAKSNSIGTKLRSISSDRAIPFYMSAIADENVRFLNVL